MVKTYKIISLKFLGIQRKFYSKQEYIHLLRIKKSVEIAIVIYSGIKYELQCVVNYIIW